MAELIERPAFSKNIEIAKQTPAVAATAASVLVADSLLLTADYNRFMAALPGESSARAVLIRNARVLTMDPATPHVEAVLVRDGRIEAAGSERELAAQARSLSAEEMDLGGSTLVPGFIDAHIHLLGHAAKLLSVDCSPSAVGSIADIQAKVRERAARLPKGTWVRCSGYDELALKERRHPDRRDLDAAAPEHPVRLVHRSGHASVLNSLALQLCGIGPGTPEPPGGYMERNLDTGEPSGLLIEMDEVIDAAVPPLADAELRAAVGEASRGLLAAGVTFIEDASSHNGRAEWDLFASLQAKGILRQPASIMEGYERLGELPAGSGRLRRGPVKVMPKELEHEFQPRPAELAAMLDHIRRAGRKAAVHAVTRRGVQAVLEAFETRGGSLEDHRIEHCGLCSPSDAGRIARLGLAVVTQPGFLYQNGDLMLQRISSRDLPDLYPVRRLFDAGVPVAGSTDAPVIEPDVVSSMRAAVQRRSRSGAPLALEQACTPYEALAMFTSCAARVLGMDGERGRIQPGLAADFAVLNQDPTGPDVDWDSLAVEMTILGGELAYSRERLAGRV